MRSILWVLCSFWCAAADKPPASDEIGTARWLLSQTSWGILATTSAHLNGTAFGNPISLVDGANGTPYFYVSPMDTSIQDLQNNPQCTLSLSEASVDCGSLNLDPGDPRCTRLSLSGTMVNVIDEAEKATAKSVLFEQHPAMKSWPADHGWLIQKLDIQHIWLENAVGGAVALSVQKYLAAAAPTRGHPVSPAHPPSNSQPFFTQKAATARWLVRESNWATLATTSVHLGGVAFGSPVSMADGTQDNGTGIPYILISTKGASTEDLSSNAKCTLTFSQAEVNCALHGLFGAYDPEDPRCTRLSLTGTMVRVKETAEKAFAEQSLVSKHPAMKQWFGTTEYTVVKLQIEQIWLIDFFGGASHISVEDYFKVSNALMAYV